MGVVLGMFYKKRRKGDLDLQSEWVSLTENLSIFGSWPWIFSWWGTWAKNCKLDLQLYSFHADSERVVAIAPLFLSQVKSRLGITLNQLQVIGNIYPSNTTVLSEYTDLVVSPDYISEVSSAFTHLLDGIRWDDFVVPYTTQESFLFKYLQDRRGDFRYFSVRDEGAGVAIDTSGSFSDYLRGLGKNTRLKLYNRRQLLQSFGSVKIEYANAAGIGEYLSELNGLDRSRWGRDCFGPQSLAFHVEIAGHASQRGELKLSRITVNCEVVSVLYNICFNGVEYNIQSAFKQDYHPKISLGTLHLGYAIERAFNDDKIESFDLLYGEGKNTFYKQRLGGDEIQFYTILCGKTYRALLVFRTKVIFRRIKSVFRRFFPF